MRNPSLPASEPINDCSACVCVGVCAVWGGWRQVGAACPSAHTWRWQWRNKSPLPWGEGVLKSCTFMLLLKHRPSRVSVCVVVRASACWIHERFHFFPKHSYLYIQAWSHFQHSKAVNTMSTPTLEPLYALVPSDSFFFIPRRCNVALEGSSRIGLAGGWHAWEYVMVAMELQWLIFSGPVKREMRQR